VWLAERGKGATFNGTPARTSSRQHVDRRTLIAVDHYGSYSAMDQLASLHTTAWIKDFGSSALHLAGVSSGMFDAYVTSAQKGHEIAAGYLLISEAGGSVTSFKGKSIENDAYDFNATYEIAACATIDLGRAVLGLLSRSE
jgi:myo-inositol-1(or 4)-monophosphatase